MKRLFVFLFLLSFAAQICSQSKPKAWSLQQCIRYAIQNNVRLQQIELNRNSKEVSLDVSKNSWLPSVNASVGQNFDIGRSPSKDGTIKDQSSANANFYLQSTMPLFEGLKIKNEIKAQEWNVLASMQNLLKAKEDVTVNVFSYYMQVLFKREIEKIAQEQVTLCTNQLKRTEVLVENGKIAKSQLYDIEAQLTKDKVTLVDAKNEVSLALLDLIQAMNLDVDENKFDIETPNLEAIVSEYMNMVFYPDAVYDDAITFKPQIIEQEYLLESAIYSLDIAKSGYYPRLNLTGSYSNYYYHFTGLENAPFSDQLKQNVRRTIGITLSIPIFSRFQIKNNVRDAQIAITNQKLAIKDAHQTLYKEIRQAYANAIAAKKVCLSSEISVIATLKSYEYAEESYDAGRISAFEYNEAKIKYIQSLSDQKQAIFNLILRCKILDFYNGIPIIL